MELFALSGMACDISPSQTEGSKTACIQKRGWAWVRSVCVCVCVLLHATKTSKTKLQTQTHMYRKASPCKHFV